MRGRTADTVLKGCRRDADSARSDAHLPERTDLEPGYRGTGIGESSVTTGRKFEDRPPDKPHLTGYDETHLSEYLRLLDADAEGADWREAVAIIFGIDPAREPDRARIVHQSHLARARWMTEVGYAWLLGPRLH